MNATTSTNKPHHVAIIMDGNGRWAKKRGLPRVAGHRAGVKTLRRLIEYAVQIELGAITVYAFSRENWQRPEKEVELLMDLFIKALQSEVSDLNDNNVCLKFIGDRTAFNKKLQNSIAESESLTSSNTGLRMNVAANYSGRWDILQASKKIHTEMAEKKLSVDALTETMMTQHLSLNNIDEPELFIRTGGEQRISNYLLWQLAYTELYFTDTLWPDFDEAQMDMALEWYGQRQRRFGKTSEQIEHVEGS